MANDFQRLALLAKRVQQENPKLTYRQARNKVIALERQYQTQGNRPKK